MGYKQLVDRAKERDNSCALLLKEVCECFSDKRGKDLVGDGGEAFCLIITRLLG